MYRIGVDVGGTNTDSAILTTSPSSLSDSSRGVLASCKTPTTVDITSGIKDVVERVLQQSGVRREEVLSVAIGTTHFVNAVVECDQRRLERVAVVRLCGPFTREIEPFMDFPVKLKEIMGGPVFFLDGGLEIDGREILPLNTAQIHAAVESIKSAGVKMVAIVGVFSPLDYQGIHEEQCKKLMLQHDPSLSVVCSHDIGGPGLLERENATILNASILPLARRTIRGFRRAMAQLQLTCPLYLTQNDGTLTDADAASEFPIKTFASGPTNSMAGAAFLAGLDLSTTSKTDRQILVADIGGTTTDVCALLPSGFPRQAPNFVEIGGVRTAFSMPEVLSVGLGGGSRVVIDDATGTVKVGPESVGHYLTTKAMVFGGQEMTTTDIVVASGAAMIGDTENVKSIPESVIMHARKQMTKIFEGAIEDMKVSAAPVTVLLVGGGSIIYIDELKGVTDCIIPPHHDSANAVGAAIAKVAGEVDLIEILDGQDEDEVTRRAEATAIETAIQKGADSEDVKVVELEKIPLQYVSNKATRIRVKAIGKLKAVDIGKLSTERQQSTVFDEEPVSKEEEKQSASAPQSAVKPSLYIDIATYRPDVKSGVWHLSPLDLEFIASGTGVLGTGGGGPSYLQYLVGLRYLQDGGAGKMRVISPKSLKDDDLCVFGSWYGAPSVSGERIPAGTEIMTAIDSLNSVLGHKDFQAIIADEIGGGNGLATFPSSAHYDRPVVDGDLMGRAYPTMEHGTPYVYGHPITPCALADPKGNVSIVMSAESNKRVETMLRTTCVELGLNTSVVARPLSGQVIKEFAIPNTVSQAWYIGRAIHMGRRSKSNLLKAIFDVSPGKLLYTGKIIDVKRDVSKGYTVGRCTIRPLSKDEQERTEDDKATKPNEHTVSVPEEEKDKESRNLVIPFQNEFLYAAYISSAALENEASAVREEIIATVPDLISVLGPNGEAIGSQELRYGLKVNVIAMAAHPLWTDDPRGLAVGGPAYFGLDMEWKRTRLGGYQVPRSVIEEFDS